MSGQANPAQRWTDALPYLMPGIAVLGLYAALFHIWEYAVTVGGLSCIPTIALSLRRLHLRLWVFGLVGPLFAWPWIVFLGAGFFGAELLPSSVEFLQSVGLWSVSLAVLVLAVISRSPVELRWGRWVLIVVFALMALQSVGAGIFGDDLGYRIVAPLVGVDLSRSYQRFVAVASARAIGTYYEPSMCARVVGTLCFIDVMQRRRYVSNMLLLALATVLTQSFGLVLMVAGIGGVLLGRSLRGVLTLLLAAAILSGVAGGLVERRASIEQSRSTYIRVVAPLHTLGWVLENEPLGVVMGSAEQLAVETGYLADTGETKITNGIYEFITFFGIIGIALVVAGLGGVVRLFAGGEQEWAAALAYLLMSTALSGSFLSIESSLLTYFLIVTARTARARRIDQERAWEKLRRAYATAATLDAGWRGAAALPPLSPG